MEMIECPCCHGVGELEMYDERGRISFRICTHCMGKGVVKEEDGYGGGARVEELARIFHVGVEW